MATQCARFWKKVQKGNDQHCWEWLASKNERGYGQFYLLGKMQKAHRVAYLLSHGEIPTDFVVRHKCDNPGCCNPNHLEVGTVADNNNDREVRGRGNPLKGINNPAAKLTEQDVRDIRNNNRTQKEIAKSYKVRQQHIQKIKSLEIWKDLA